MSQLTNDLSTALSRRDAATVARLLEGQCADQLMVFPNVPLLVVACGITDLPVACLEAVLVHTKDVDVADYTGQTGLMIAAMHGQLAAVRRMLAAGASVRARDQQGRTALHVAVLPAQPQRELLEALLAAGAEVAAPDGDGATPLHVAARVGHLATVCLLLEGGAPINAASKTGRTPLHCAADAGHTEVCRCLMQRGAAVDATDAEGWTPLLLAVAGWNYPAARALLERGANPNARLSANLLLWGGATPLALALGCFDGWMRDERAPARVFEREFFEDLLRAGADPRIRLADGRTLLQLAEGLAPALDFLRQQGCEA